MMSQNRQDTKDRLRGELDFDVNRRAESEIQALTRKLNLLDEKVDDVGDMLRKASEMTKPGLLRALLGKDGLITAPGAYDCITARMIEQAGFSAVYMTGAGTSAMLGYPDYGLVTMSEMVENAGRIAASVKVPVIADADTGYGNELNVVRTVREYEQRGVAGIHIEDQGFPKKCGHLENKVRHSAGRISRKDSGSRCGQARSRFRDHRANGCSCRVGIRAGH